MVRETPGKPFLARLYESTESYCCHFDVGMCIGITLYVLCQSFLWYGQEAILYIDRSCCFQSQGKSGSFVRNREIWNKCEKSGN